MRKIKKLLILIMMLTNLFVGKTYATSNINPNQTEFKVRFSGEPIVSNEEKVKAAITNDLNATINVTDLTIEENIETVTYIVQNISKDLSAEISLNVSNSNKEYFLVESEIKNNTLAKGEATEVTIKVELLKEPVEKQEKSTIGIQLDVKPIQPTEDNSQKQEPNEPSSSSSSNDSSSSSSSSSSNSTSKPSQTTTTNQNYEYYEKDETPKTGIFKFIDIFWR